MASGASVIVLESSLQAGEEIASRLRRFGYRAAAFAGIPPGERGIKEAGAPVGVVMVDHRLVDAGGKAVLAEFTRNVPDVNLIYLLDEEHRTGAFNDVFDGLYDYLTIPASDQRLRHVLETAMDRRVRFLLEKYYQRYLEEQVQIQLTDLAAQKGKILLADRLSTVGHAAAGIVHELNNPLLYMKLNVETLRHFVGEYIGLLELYARSHPDYRFRKMDANEMKDETGNIMDSLAHGLSHMETILHNIRRFSRKPEYEPAEFDIHQSISNALNFLRASLKPHIRVKTEFCGSLPLLKGDPIRMEQVFLNLLINASYALWEVEPGLITIRTERHGNTLKVFVSDNGPGIPYDIMPKIFDPFFTTKPKNVGTGLGLSICREIVTEFSGTLEAQSEIGKGAVFVLSLPLEGGLGASPG